MSGPVLVTLSMSTQVWGRSGSSAHAPWSAAYVAVWAHRRAGMSV